MGLYVRKYLTKALLPPAASLVLGVMVLFLVDADPAFAQSPVVTVAHWNSQQWCIDWIHGTYDVDTFTRDALPGEVYTSWHSEALRANAILIRSVAYYHTIYPQSGFPFCNGTPPQSYNIHTGRVQGWSGGRGAVMGNVNNRTNDRVTDTGGRILLQNNGVLWLSFNDCLQNYSRDLADQGQNYTHILANSQYGVYGTEQPCEGIPSLSNLSVNFRYSFVNSMTNGTAPVPLSGGQRTTEATPVLTERQAERYWGFAHLDLVQANPFDQPGTYVVGYHRGDKAEYRMYFGGSYSNLHLIGIADRPSPVTMNIYIDGYYRGQMSWTNNDNARHLTIGSFSGISYGVHPICVEFQNDYWQYPPGGDEYDRNFYLDVLGAVN